MKALDIQLTAKSVSSFFRTMVLDNIDEREKNRIFRPDMINILMHVKKGRSTVTKKKMKNIQ